MRISDWSSDVRSYDLMGGIVPVQQLVQERVDERAAIVLVIQVVGVLPDIAGHQRRLPVNDRCDRVGGADDAQRAAVVDEPSPAATELCARDVRELLLEVVETAEVALDALGEFAFRRTAIGSAPCRERVCQTG